MYTNYKKFQDVSRKQAWLNEGKKNGWLNNIKEGFSYNYDKTGLVELLTDESLKYKLSSSLSPEFIKKMHYALNNDFSIEIMFRYAVQYKYNTKESSKEILMEIFNNEKIADYFVEKNDEDNFFDLGKEFLILIIYWRDITYEGLKDLIDNKSYEIRDISRKNRYKNEKE